MMFHRSRTGLPAVNADEPWYVRHYRNGFMFEVAAIGFGIAAAYMRSRHWEADRRKGRR